MSSSQSKYLHSIIGMAFCDANPFHIYFTIVSLSFAVSIASLQFKCVFNSGFICSTFCSYFLLNILLRRISIKFNEDDTTNSKKKMCAYYLNQWIWSVLYAFLSITSTRFVCFVASSVTVFFSPFEMRSCFCYANDSIVW